MAVAFIQEFKVTDGDTSTKNYDSVAEKVGRGRIDGLIVHTAGFDTEAGVFRIFDVWESNEALSRFYDETLRPTIEEMMATAGNDESLTPPNREGTYELHDEMH